MTMTAEGRTETRALKATLSTTAGWAPERRRLARTALAAAEPPTVLDLLPRLEPAGTSGFVTFMAEAPPGNASAVVDEGGTKPESALSAAEQTVPLKKVATVLPVTNEAMADDAMARAYVSERLPAMLLAALEAVVVADLLAWPGILTQPRGVDTALDAIAKSLVAVRSTGKAKPDGVVMNPQDFQNLALSKAAAAGLYFGEPLAYAPASVWGIPVVLSSDVTPTNALVGDFGGYSALVGRDGISVDRTDSHGSNFTLNVLALRAETRAALVLFRASAYCKVTGL